MRKALILGLVLVFALAGGLVACGGEETTTTTAAPATTAPPATEPGTPDIVDTAIAAGSFTTLVSLVQAAGLVDTLKSPGPFTVFAPTDEAFAAVPKETLDALGADPTGALASVLTYHVVAGQVMSTDITDGMEAETVEGSTIKLTIKDGMVYVNDAKVVQADIVTSNGVIHVIDAVLIPPSGGMSYPEGNWKFTFNTFFPATNRIAIVGEMWMAEITKRTNGAVQFDYLPGASLTPPPKVYDGVTTGISDLGFSVFAYTPGIFPVMDLLDYPNGYPAGYVATHVINDYYNKFKPAELDKVKALAFYGTGPQVVFTVKKPVMALADMKGLVIRSTGVGAGIATALGAEGYAAPQNEAYELMSKGVIDGSIAPREVLLGWKQAEVVNNVTQCFSIGSVTSMYLIMNLDKWNALPPDVQQVFTEVSEEYVEYWAKVGSAYDYDAMVFFNEQGGDRQVIDQTPEEAALWVDAVQPMINKKLDDLKAAGLTEDYQAFLLERIKYWTDNAVSEADCSAWVAENIKSPSVQ
jgi:TRAP-type transport system periplasmic protein